jgi:hypothetical protein
MIRPALDALRWEWFNLNLPTGQNLIFKSAGGISQSTAATLE